MQQSTGRGPSVYVVALALAFLGAGYANVVAMTRGPEGGIAPMVLGVSALGFALLAYHAHRVGRIYVMRPWLLALGTGALLTAGVVMWAAGGTVGTGYLALVLMGSPLILRRKTEYTTFLVFALLLVLVLAVMSRGSVSIEGIFQILVSGGLSWTLRHSLLAQRSTTASATQPNEPRPAASDPGSSVPVSAAGAAAAKATVEAAVAANGAVPVATSAPPASDPGSTPRRRFTDEGLDLISASSIDAIYDWEIASEKVTVSKHLEAMLGFIEGELGTQPKLLIELVHPDDLERVRSELVEHLKSAATQFESQFRAKRKDGTHLPVLCRGSTVRGAGGRGTRMVGAVTDLVGRGTYDPLTGLATRDLLRNRLTRVIAERVSGGPRYAVLYMDLNRFKMVNDTLGHHVGDHLLVEVASRLRECAGPRDTVARLGGDEFVVLLENVERPSQIHETTYQIGQRLGEPYNLENRELYTSASIGAVIETDAYQTPDEVLRDADTAMYEAKEHGKGVVVFDVAMRHVVTARLRLETELQQAIRRREFAVHFQPILNLETGRLEAAEALARWHHPQRGIVAAAEFVPVLEETGWVVPLDLWALRESCRQTLALLAQGIAREALPICVNLSATQFSREGVVEDLKKIVREFKFRPENIRIEVTESAMMSDPDRASKMLAELGRFGFKFYLDDFGTGQSALAYLHRFPIHGIKLDLSFVHSLSDPPDEFGDGLQAEVEIVRSIVQLARTLSLTTVGEGIETAEQFMKLRELKCEQGQGFLFGTPVPLPAVYALERRLASKVKGLVAEGPAAQATAGPVASAAGLGSWPSIR